MDTLLTQAQQAFLEWRGERKYAGRLSNRLKKMALSLLEHHSPLTVSHAIGIPPKTLRRWKEKTISTNQEENTVNFISLPLVEVSQTTEEEKIVPSVIKPVELVVRLPGHLELMIPPQPIKKTMELIRALSEEFSS